MYQKHLCYHYTMGTPKVTAVYYTLCAGIFALKGLALKEVFRLGKWIRRAGGGSVLGSAWWVCLSPMWVLLYFVESRVPWCCIRYAEGVILKCLWNCCPKCEASQNPHFSAMVWIGISVFASFSQAILSRKVSR